MSECICGVHGCYWNDHVRSTEPMIRRFMKREDARAARKRAQSARVGSDNIWICSQKFTYVGPK